MYMLALYNYERAYVVTCTVLYIVHIISHSVCVLIHVAKGVYVYTVYFNVSRKILDRVLTYFA